ncbi:Cytoplasmic glyoxalase II [Elasticomyces elasticus]|nr:Cytoplasmic glyoxalase II [Elasticomyces elasticus]
MTFLAARRFILRHPRSLVIATVGIAAVLSSYYVADQREKPIITRKMHIESIPMWEGSGNNYAYLVTDDMSKEAVIIDPANPSEYVEDLPTSIIHYDVFRSL